MFAQKKNGRCPRGYRSKDGTCVNKEDYEAYVSASKKKRCVAGTKRSNKTGKCEGKPKATRKRTPDKKCTEDRPYRSAAGNCVKTKPGKYKPVSNKYTAEVFRKGSSSSKKPLHSVTGHTPKATANQAYTWMIAHMRKKPNRVSVDADRKSMRAQMVRGSGAAASERFSAYMVVRKTASGPKPSSGCPAEKPYVSPKTGRCVKTRPSGSSGPAVSAETMALYNDDFSDEDDEDDEDYTG